MFSVLFIMGEDHLPPKLAVLLIFSEHFIMGEDHHPPTSAVLSNVQ
jgi:hypothetical protein